MSIKPNVPESAIIICLGLLMHVYSLSIIELRYSKLPLLTPNAASSLFVLSILCIFAKLRTIWPHTTCMPQKFLIFLAELALIFYATDLILRQIWLPCLKLLNLFCHFLGQYILAANQNFLAYNAPQLSNWIRNDAFYIARFLLAFIIFTFMLSVTDFLGLLQEAIGVVGGSIKIVDLAQNENEINSDCHKYNLNPNPKKKPFNVYELPCVPQDDILTLANSFVPRQKKPKSVRKTKRKSKVLLDDDSSEYNC